MLNSRSRKENKNVQVSISSKFRSISCTCIKNSGGNAALFGVCALTFLTGLLGLYLMRIFSWKPSLKWCWTLYSNRSYQIIFVFYSLPVLPIPQSLISHMPKTPIPSSIPTLPFHHLIWSSAASLWAPHSHFCDAFFFLAPLLALSLIQFLHHSYLFSFTFLVVSLKSSRFQTQWGMSGTLVIFVAPV